jgi:chemotaxis protein MotB
MRCLMLVVAVLSSGGCVSKAKYAELENQYDALQDKVERMEAMNRKEIEAFEQLMRDFQPLIDKGILDVTIVDGRMTIAMASDVLFESGSAELSEEGAGHLKVIADKLAARTDREFQVEGHTDSDPISTEAFPDNLHLGAARAMNVMQLMLDSGMPADHISAATFGDARPVASNSSDEGKALNRRIEIVLLPDLSELPSYEALLQRATELPPPARRGPAPKPPGPKPPGSKPPGPR